MATANQVTPLTIELVRFEVPPERQGALIAGHDDARRAIHALSPPGAVWSRLARIGESGWLEVVAWPDRAVFDRALERAPSDPIAGAWFGLAEPGWTIEMGEIADPPAGPPPREGELELIRLRGGAEIAAHAEEGWGAAIEVEARAWIDPSGWSEREPSRLVLIAPPRAGAAPEGPEAERELALIAHAVDAVAEPAG